jgi:general secretion pathway protein E
LTAIMLPFELHLVEAGRLGPAALERARQLADESGERLGAVLTRLGLISERELADALAGFTGLEVAGSAAFPPAPILERELPGKFLKRVRLVPLEDRPDGIVLAMADPLDDESAESVAFALDRPVIRRIACATDLESAWDRLYGGSESAAPRGADKRDESGGEDAERLKDLASEAPVIRLVNQLIARAVERRASDIHVEPMPDRLRVRYRVDGVLEEIEPPPRRLGPAIVSRVKIMAKLNIAERRLAQDGRIRVAVRGQDIDLRVATNPSIHGEGVVLRILDRGGSWISRRWASMPG